MSRLRVLALSPVPYEGAGCRFRIAQYVPHLASQGIDVTIAPFYDRRFFELVYRRGRQLQKALRFVRQAAARLATIATSGRYDVILVYREAFPIGPAVLEAALAGLGRPLVYDFDDAVFLPNTSEANRFAAALKCPWKIGSIIGHCREVMAGNDFLADYARRFNPSVHVIPTVLDTNVFVPRAAPRAVGAPAVVGWIGTPTTAPYLADLAAPLDALARRHDFVFRVAGVLDRVDMPGIAIEHAVWSLEREVELFNTSDIGVYPLPDTDWARGKCGFKAIQFMACGVPVVASPVGVNREIIDDGVNGFLAATPSEWQDKIGRLLADDSLRRAIGSAARRTIEQRYSLHINAPRVAGVIRQAASRLEGVEPIAQASGGRR